MKPQLNREIIHETFNLFLEDIEANLNAGNISLEDIPLVLRAKIVGKRLVQQSKSDDN